MRIYKLFIAVSLVLSFCMPSHAFALEFSELSQLGSNAIVEGQVRATFAPTPVMIAIAQCESGFRQFNPAGTVLRGGSGGVLGIFQISEAHTVKALSLGYDIQAIEGNIGYAKYLYEKQGTTPWMAAFPCWNAAANSILPSTPTNPSVSSPSSNSSTLVSDLSFGMDTAEVKVLQQLLNKIGFQVSTSGLGSPGQETTSFGNLTRATVRKFQCVKTIVCTGDEHATGYGLVNAATRQALLALVPADVTTAPPAPSATLPPAAPASLIRELEYGMEGSDVAFLQTFLASQGLFTAGVNGTFGPVTRAAVIAFQKKYALNPAYGYVGPKTLAKIKQLASQ